MNDCYARNKRYRQKKRIEKQTPLWEQVLHKFHQSKIIRESDSQIIASLLDNFEIKEKVL